MVFPNVLLRVLPELVVVLALDDVATDARDLLHALIVCETDLNMKQPLLPMPGRRSGSRQRAAAASLDELDERFAK